MIEKKDVEKLAELSRIEVSENEKAVLIKDLDAILGYVSDVGEVVTDEVVSSAGRLRNVMREDKSPHKPKEFSEEVMDEAPDSKNGFLKVKKIL